MLIDSADRLLYMTLAPCAAGTSTIMLGPGVTNPLTRHPSVTANAMATLHTLSGGRGLLGIGVGDSALRALGLVPATFGTLTGYSSTVREIFAERGISIPVYMAAMGGSRPPLCRGRCQRRPLLGRFAASSTMA